MCRIWWGRDFLARREKRNRNIRDNSERASLRIVTVSVESVWAFLELLNGAIKFHTGWTPALDDIWLTVGLPLHSYTAMRCDHQALSLFNYGTYRLKFILHGSLFNPDLSVS